MNQLTQQRERASTSLLEPAATRLRFSGGGRDGQVVRIGAKKFTIGGSEKATFRLVHSSMEPFHCEIERNETGATIRSISESTKLNGQAFDEAELAVGDRITIGAIDFEVLPPDGETSSTRSSDQAEQDLQAESLKAEKQRLESWALELDERSSVLEAERTAWQNEQDEQSFSDKEFVALRAKVEAAEAMLNNLENGDAAADLESERQEWQRQIDAKEQELNALRAELEATQNSAVATAGDAHPSITPNSEGTMAMEMLERLRAEVQAQEGNNDDDEAVAQSESLGPETNYSDDSSYADDGSYSEDGSYSDDSLVSNLTDDDQYSDEGHYASDDASAGDAGDYFDDNESTEPNASAPLSEEELTFSEPSSEAPVDTAAILARFGHSIEDFEDEPAAPTPPPAPVPVSEPSAHDAEDADMEDYMASLMARVGGSAAQADSSSSSSSPPVDATQPPPKPEPVPQNTTPLDPSEFVPRARAPEASSNLQALRAVANTSARSAIDKHQRGSQEQTARLLLFISIVSGIVSLAMAVFSEQLFSVATAVSMISMLICVFTGIKSLSLSARAKFGSKKEPAGEATEEGKKGKRSKRKS